MRNSGKSSVRRPAPIGFAVLFYSIAPFAALHAQSDTLPDIHEAVSAADRVILEATRRRINETRRTVMDAIRAFNAGPCATVGTVDGTIAHARCAQDDEALRRRLTDVEVRENLYRNALSLALVVVDAARPADLERVRNQQAAASVEGLILGQFSGASITLNGRTQPYDGRVLRAGDVVTTTTSGVVVIMSDGSRIQLGPRSRIEIWSTDGTTSRYAAIAGRISQLYKCGGRDTRECRRIKWSLGGRVHEGTVIMTVRGTNVTMDVLRSETRITVREGAVSLDTPTGRLLWTVRAGESVIVSTTGGRPTVRVAPSS